MVSEWWLFTPWWRGCSVSMIQMPLRLPSFDCKPPCFGFHVLEYGFASLFFRMFVEAMLISHLHWPLFNNVAASSLFQAVVNIFVPLSVWKITAKPRYRYLCLTYSSRTTDSEERQGRPGAPGLGVSPCPAHGHLAHQKKKRRSSCCNLQACGERDGTGKGKSRVLRDRKSLKPVAAVTPSSSRYLCSFI